MGNLPSRPKTYHIRHVDGMRANGSTREELWEKDLRGIDHPWNSTSGKKANSIIGKLALNGGYVCAEYSLEGTSKSTPIPKVIVGRVCIAREIAATPARRTNISCLCGLTVVVAEFPAKSVAVAERQG